MYKVIQTINSPGFGGLEMVIVEFHEWLLSQNIDSTILVTQDTPIEKSLLAKGLKDSIVAFPTPSQKKMKDYRIQNDSPNTILLFHSHQDIKKLGFHRYKAKVSMISHTFYDVRKRDLWHRFIFSKVNCWIALTKRHKENLIDTTGINPEKIVIIPNGVSLKKFKPVFKKPPQSDQPIKIGVIARLDPKKGQDLAIKALKKLIDQTQRSVTLHFLGQDTPNEKPVKPNLQKLAQELQIEKNVIFEGFHSDLGKFVNDLDLIWMPSHKETFGRCVIEGMASAVPVIASNAGGVPDIIQHQVNGILFETMNADDLCHQTIELLNNPDLFTQIQNNAVVDIQKNYDVDQIWKKVFNAIKP